MKKLKKILAVLPLLMILSCNGQTVKSNASREKQFSITKSEEQWKKELSDEQFEVLRKKGTERPFSGEYVDNFKKGKYVCAACENKLFDSDSKFHTECGWPSFDKAIEGSVLLVKDNSHGMTRTEVVCSRCGGHLGHVFDDGPRETTGERFCTNSVSVKFIPE